MLTLALLSLLAACGTSTDDGSTATNGDAQTASDFSTAPKDVAAPPADATVTASGLAYKVIKAGTGKDYPKRQSRVEVHYTGWTTDGKMFDSSHKRGKTITFGLGGVIAGWTEGLQLMVEGETARLWIPEELAYKGRPGRPAGMLVFDVELVKIIPPRDMTAVRKKRAEALTKAYPAPPDVAAPPKGAKRTKSGLAYKTLKKGKGKRHPGPTDKVEVHYTGWQTDGTTFDSSKKRGKSVSFGLNGVIAGWTEGLQLMVEGETARLWIPPELAYAGRPDAPQGMLVFDVELLKIK
jgi:peptidylprolyl isomerase